MIIEKSSNNNVEYKEGQKIYIKVYSKNGNDRYLRGLEYTEKRPWVGDLTMIIGGITDKEEKDETNIFIITKIKNSFFGNPNICVESAINSDFYKKKIWFSYPDKNDDKEYRGGILYRKQGNNFGTYAFGKYKFHIEKIVENPEEEEEEKGDKYTENIPKQGGKRVRSRRRKRRSRNKRRFSFRR